MSDVSLSASTAVTPKVAHQHGARRLIGPVDRSMHRSSCRPLAGREVVGHRASGRFPGVASAHKHAARARARRW